MRKKEGDKHRDLLNSGLKIFALKGFEQTKIAEVSEEAGVATGTFYLYYTNKEDLFVKLFDKIWFGLYEKFCELPVQNPPEMMRSILQTLILYLLENPERARLYIADFHHSMRLKTENLDSWDKCFDFGLDVLQRGRREGYFSDEVVDIGYATLFGAVRGGLDLFVNNPDQIDQGMDQLLDILMRMLGK